MATDIVEGVHRIGQIGLHHGHGHAVDHTAGFILGPHLAAALLEQTRAFAPIGRGIALSRQLSFSSLTYIPPGNVVIVTVPRVRASGGAA